MAERLEFDAVPGRPPLRRSWIVRSAGVVLAVLGVLALLLWLVPGLLDWSRYRATITRFAAAELGRPVSIDGRIAVVLLPSPLLVANDVRLGDRGDGIALTAPSLRLRLALGPLLVGRVVPRELVLRRPSITLPWPLPPAAVSTDRADWLAASSASIEGGTLRVGAVVFTDMTATVSAGGPEAGGEVVTGSARSFGQAWHFDSRLGVPDAAGAAPLEASLQALPQPGAAPLDTGGAFIGTLAQAGGLSGRLTAHAADLSRLIPAPPVAAHADGTISIGGPIGTGGTLGIGGGRGVAAAQAELALDVGGVPITLRLQPNPAGAAQIVSLSSGRLDLDVWIAALTRLRAGGSTAQMIRLPWPVSLDLQADAVQLRGGMIRDLHAALDVDGARGVLRDARAMLPGDARVGLVGTLTENVDGLSLTGDATLDAPQLRLTLGWLQSTGLKLGTDLPPAVLRDAVLAGHVVAHRDRVEASGITGRIDQSAITGGVGVDTGSGAIDADITLDRLVLDDWLGQAPLRWNATSAALGPFDLALKLHVKQVQWRGASLANVALDAATSAGGVAVNSLGFGLGGLNAGLSGTIDADGLLSDGRFDLAAPQATGLSHYVPSRLPGLELADYLWAGPVHLHVEANGPQDALVAAVWLDLADARLEAHPVIDLVHDSWTAQMTLRHPGAPRLLAALGLPAARAWLGEGSLSMLAQLSGGPGRVQFDSFDITAGELHASGDLRYDSGPTPLLTGHVMADTLPLPGFWPHAAAPMPLGLLHGWAGKIVLSANQVTVGDDDVFDQATGTLDLQGGVLKLDGLAARLGGGKVAGSAVLDSTATPPHITLTGTVAGAALANTLFGTPLDLAAGSYNATLALDAQGYSPAALTASLSGTLHLAGSAGSLGGIDLAAAHQAVLAAKPVTAALAGGATMFDRLSLDSTIGAGMVTLGGATIAGPGGTIEASGTLDLPGGQMDLLAHLPDQVDLRLSGPFGAPKRIVEPGAVASTP